MEVRSTIHNIQKVVRVSIILSLLLAFVPAGVRAQKCIVKNGRMFIELSREIAEPVLDGFIAQYNLYDIGLKQLIKFKSFDSLKQLGWRVETNGQVYLISKPLLGADNISSPADKILLTEKHPTFAEMFPPVNNGILIGYNRFRNKAAFAFKGDVVTFFLRNNTRARQVMLAGSFNDWDPQALPMTKTDSGWILNVRLSPGKYWYKFIADGNWMVDDDNQVRENDGLGNTNSVFYKPSAVFILNGFTSARRVYLAGSFNSWRPKELLMNKTATGWELPVYLAEGTHTYRYVVDGDWFADPDKKEKLPNEFNDFNSVIRIGKPYLFKLEGYTNARQVVLSGSFNGWRRDELLMNKTATGWELPYTLGAGNYEYKFYVDGKWVQDAKNPLTSKGEGNTLNSYLIIEPNFTFRLTGFSNAKSVYLAGDFNNWTPGSLAMKREGDTWTFNIHLSIGKHVYKFIVDGNWIKDPNNQLWEQNEFGNGNSLIWVGK